jgi:hypothetical protein
MNSTIAARKRCLANKLRALKRRLRNGVFIPTFDPFHDFASLFLAFQINEIFSSNDINQIRTARRLMIEYVRTSLEFVNIHLQPDNDETQINMILRETDERIANVHNNNNIENTDRNEDGTNNDDVSI